MTTEHELLTRITARPDIFGGKPIIRDMRISVEFILSLLGSVAEKGRVGDWRGSGRRMGVAVAGGFRNAGASLPAMAPFPVAALRTGHADLPHPALQWDHAFRTRNTLAAAGSR